MTQKRINDLKWHLADEERLHLETQEERDRLFAELVYCKALLAKAGIRYDEPKSEGKR